MAEQPTVLACEIPQTKEPGGLRSSGVAKVGRDLVTKRRTRVKYGAIMTSTCTENDFFFCFRCSAVTLVAGRKSLREGTRVSVWRTHFAVQQKLAQHCKAAKCQ